MSTYNFCPRCGNKLNVAHCDSCNKTYYNDPKPGVGVLPVKDGKVLLARRGREPMIGALDIIGGFLEPGELPEAGAMREAKEETGLDVRIVDLLGMYTDTYGDSGDATLNIHYIAEVANGEMKAQDDVAELNWTDIESLPLSEGFKNTQEALRDLQNWYKANISRD